MINTTAKLLILSILFGIVN